MCCDLLKIRRAQRLGVYRCFMNKVTNMLYKTAHEETQKQKYEQIAIDQNDLLKATMSQRHRNYYGSVKTGVRQQLHHL